MLTLGISLSDFLISRRNESKSLPIGFYCSGEPGAWRPPLPLGEKQIAAAQRRLKAFAAS